MKLKKTFVRSLFSVLAVFVLMCFLITGMASAELFSWTCSECGRTGNTGKFCGTCAHPAPDTEASCTITWKDDTGKTIDTTIVMYGEMPTHSDPEKASDKQYTYTFSGWEPEITAATEDTVYTALFSKETRTYKITWKDDTGKTIDTTTVAYGKKPTHAKPAKASDKKYTYSFSGWEPEITKVTGNATYKATFKKKAKVAPALPVLSEAYPGLDVRLKSAGDDGYRVYSYLGPGKAYVPSGGYKPAKQRKVTVYFQEDGFVLADVQYQTTEERFVYLPKGSLSVSGSIPDGSKMKTYTGTANGNITPSRGPDGRFNSVSSLAVKKGTKLTVFFQENGFIYAEYSCDKGKVRMWLPADKVTVRDASVALSGSPITPAGGSNVR